jgi:pimeloyl-ACP methyl ester carboxylesterase
MCQHERPGRQRQAPSRCCGIRVGPALPFISGSIDPVITSILEGERIEQMERVLPNLKAGLLIPGAGHWIQRERPFEVNEALIQFLRDVRNG